MAFRYKCVLLVGATSGIGAAMADKLVREGVKVIAVGRRQDRLDGFVRKHGTNRASGIRFDVTDRAGMDSFVNGVVEKYPDLDCVFLNAGMQTSIRLSRPEEVNLDAFHHEINTNFTSLVDLSIKFLVHLLKKDYPTGLIITGSHLSIIPAATLPAYCASKAALRTFVDCLRKQNEKAKTKIIEISAPVVQTELHDYLGEEQGRSMGMPVNEFVQKAYDKISAGEEIVIIGPFFSEEKYMDVVTKRQQLLDGLSNMLLRHFEL
ncbi:putative short-chain dehydrogenase reductase [Lipomyces kononenkoae]|uniref:Short-chain dehydrogenase reductase n=1 Tax=Lipomyces kononenkoae TaxID=34357 RepID=A0ACC3SU01_LIPKO